MLTNFPSVCNFSTHIDSDYLPRLQELKSYIGRIIPENTILIDNKHTSYSYLYDGYNVKYITTVFDDIMKPLNWSLGKVNEKLKVNNNSLCIITSVHILTDISLSNISIIHIAEFNGLYRIYDPIQQSHTKIFNFCSLRIQMDRLYMFRNLCNNDLLDIGYVSFHNFNKTKTHDLTELLSLIQHTNNNTVFDAIIEDLPYYNFKDNNKFYELESECLFSIVYETYNSEDAVCKFGLITEKTIRSLQVPNISLFVNTTGMIQQLKNYGFKFHPINYILDKISTFIGQTDLICEILKHPEMLDINYDTMYNNALHNSNIIKQHRETLQTDEFYERLKERIANN